MNKKQNKFILGAVIVVTAIGYLIFTGISKTAVYYLTITELIEQKEKLKNEGIRVQGKVVAGSIKKESKTLKVAFDLSDDKNIIPVAYEGVIPDLFEDKREVIVEGVFSSEGLFKATTLLTNCPSKYEAEKPAGGVQKG